MVYLSDESVVSLCSMHVWFGSEKGCIELSVMNDEDLHPTDLETARLVLVSKLAGPWLVCPHQTVEGF